MQSAMDPVIHVGRVLIQADGRKTNREPNPPWRGEAQGEDQYEGVAALSLTLYLTSLSLSLSGFFPPFSQFLLLTTYTSTLSVCPSTETRFLLAPSS